MKLGDGSTTLQLLQFLKTLTVMKACQRPKKEKESRTFLRRFTKFERRIIVYMRYGTLVGPWTVVSHTLRDIANVLLT